MCVFCIFYATHTCILSNVFICFSESAGLFVYKTGMRKNEIEDIKKKSEEFIYVPAGKLYM